MRRTRHLRHGAWAVALAAALVFSAQSSEADEYPGLTDPPAEMGQSWAGAAQGGMSYAKRAKQWFRSPITMVTFNSVLKYESIEPTVKHAYAAGRAFMVSPEGAPAPYGYLPPLTVRSVGFGLMPVEATVQVSQRRENGYPVPLSARLPFTEYLDPTAPGGVSHSVMHPAVVNDAFNVQILAVRVDGVDLGLTGDCRTVTPAPVSLSSPEYTIPLTYKHFGWDREWFSTQDPATFYHPLWGGELSGTMTIPPFTGCTTAAGDDLSDLMTLSVSGPDNPIAARTGWPCGRFAEGHTWPLEPGQTTPESTMAGGWKSDRDDSPGCESSKKFVYPDRPAS